MMLGAALAQTDPLLQSIEHKLLLTTQSGILLTKTCLGRSTANFEVDTVLVAEKEISISSAEVVPSLQIW